MANEELFKKICDGTAILITGSGAHVNVENPDGHKFFSGIELINHLYKQVGLSQDEIDEDLSNAAQTYLEKKSVDSLFKELKLLFSVGKIRKNIETYTGKNGEEFIQLIMMKYPYGQRENKKRIGFIR